MDVTVGSATNDAFRIAVAILTTDQRIEAKRLWQTRVTVRSGHTRWTDALTSVGVAKTAGTGTFSTVGEAVVSGAAVGTRPTDNVWLATALTSKVIAREAERTVEVALTLERSIVIVGRQRKGGVTTKGGIVFINGKIMTSTFCNEFYRLVHILNVKTRFGIELH